MSFDPALGLALICAATPDMQTYNDNDEGKDDGLGVEIGRTRSLPDAVPFREDNICASGGRGAKCSRGLSFFRENGCR